MTFNDLNQAILNNRGDDFITFLSKNRESIKLLFINDLSEGSLNPFVTDCFISLYQQLGTYSEHNKSTDYFQGLINQFAIYFKRCNDYSLLQACVGLCMHKSFKSRLEAFISTIRYNNVTDHISKFEEYLSLLTEGLYSEEQDFSNEIAEDLREYHYIGSQALVKHNEQHNVPVFQNLFYSNRLITNYPILGYVKDKLKISTEIKIAVRTDKVYEPSSFVAAVFDDKIIRPIKNDPRTVWYHTLLGYSKDQIRYEIIQLGQADFDESYGHDITALDKTMLYCFFNMRKHFFTSLAIFERIEGLSHLILTGGRVKLIDLGCGPGTSGLAYKDFVLTLTRQKIHLDYVGIDISSTMLNFARDILSSSLLTDESVIKTASSTSSFQSDVFVNTDCILINACYLFASPNLDVVRLAEDINSLRRNNDSVTKYFIFQNSSDLSKSIQFNRFKALLGAFECLYSSVDKIFYSNKKNSPFEPLSEDVYFEVLKL